MFFHLWIRNITLEKITSLTIVPSRSSTYLHAQDVRRQFCFFYILNCFYHHLSYCVRAYTVYKHTHILYDVKYFTCIHVVYSRIHNICVGKNMYIFVYIQKIVWENKMKNFRHVLLWPCIVSIIKYSICIYTVHICIRLIKVRVRMLRRLLNMKIYSNKYIKLPLSLNMFKTTTEKVL